MYATEELSEFFYTCGRDNLEEVKYALSKNPCLINVKGTSGKLQIRGGGGEECGIF